MSKSFLLLAFPFLFFTSCTTLSSTTGKKDNGLLDVTFIQVNDVYEIAPLNAGREGGIARVATLKKNWKQKNANAYLVMAGDFLSPSVFNSLQYGGKAIRGRQMVEALNVAGLDLAMFGNHEFDIKEAELQDRINESGFTWISTNSFHQTKEGVKPFIKANSGPIATTYILQVRDGDGTTAKIGFITATLLFNKADYVSYTEPLQAAKEAYGLLKDSVDAVVAITHQSMEEDERLARELPGLAAIIGGHEHDQRFAKIGGVTITKAMANAKNAYIVHLRINKKNRTHRVKTALQVLNETVPLDSATNEIVDKWTKVAEQNYASLGFDARGVVVNSGEPLDGRETAVRSDATNLTKLIVAAMQDAAPAADIVILNGGSIRVDDVVQLPVTQYDILRSLPFGGAVTEADMKGSLVVRVLEAGRRNRNTGGFLHYNSNLQYDQRTAAWLLNGKLLEPEKIYKVVLPEFLMSGKEANMDFLTAKNNDVVKLYPPAKLPDAKADIRTVVIQYLQKNKAIYLK